MEMTGRDLSSLIALLRSTLAQYATEAELWTPAVPVGVEPESLDPGIPAGVANLLALSDAPYFSNSTQIYGSDALSWHQEPDNLVGAKLPDGSSLADASHFFCFGKACENPLLVDITDGSVWRVPDDGVVWYTGCRLERIADNIEEFFVEWVASSKYPDLAGVGQDDRKFSDWYRLLQLCGLA